MLVFLIMSTGCASSGVVDSCDHVRFSRRYERSKRGCIIVRQYDPMSEIRHFMNVEGYCIEMERK